jgi:tRNA(Ile)-lysidine synthase TilS/MesJ
MQICARCVLPKTFPGIHFDREGVCNYCIDFKGLSLQQKRKDEYQQRFETVIEQRSGKSSYDVIMCYSGGKDSTYTLDILKEKYNLKILAASFDNGFISQQTLTNIRTIVEKLGIDHMFFKPRFDTLAKIFRYCTSNDTYTPKALERASSICTSCMGIIKYSALRMALERNIPMVAFGWSPGQAPISSSVMKNNPQMVKLMQKSVYDPLYEIVGKDIEPYFLADEHFNSSSSFPYFVHPLAFLEYDEEQMLQNNSRLGWVLPGDIGSNSTNCLLNSFANMVHKQRLGFHPYAFELANLVREGYLERHTALRKLDQAEDPHVIAAVVKKLGMGNDNF